jgi:hypothetical protein
LHFDGVSLFKSSVKNTRGIQNLDLNISVTGVTYEDILGTERHGGNLDVCLGNLVHETTFSHVRESEQ